MASSVSIQFPETTTEDEVNDFVTGLTLPSGASVSVVHTTGQAYGVSESGTPEPISFATPTPPEEPPA